MNNENMKFIMVLLEFEEFRILYELLNKVFNYSSLPLNKIVLLNHVVLNCTPLVFSIIEYSQFECLLNLFCTYTIEINNLKL